MELFNTGYGNTHADLCAIIANLAGIQLKETFTTLQDFHANNQEAKNLQATLPSLQTPEGLLTSSLSIARYLAAHKPELLGKSDFERALVDQWVLIIRNEVQPIARVIAYQVFGHVQCDQTEHNYVYGLIKEALKLINAHLKGKTYFVGNSLTIVDVYFTLVQMELQQCILDTNFRNSMSNINNHFKLVAALPEFRSRMGAVKQGKKQFVPNFNLNQASAKDLNKSQKKEASKQKTKQTEQGAKPDKKEEEKEEQAAVKKSKNPLDDLPPSKFDMNDWKKFFSNHPNKHEAMEKFWTTHDPQGYSIWELHYQKYAGEGEVLHMTKNLMDGFLQRSEHFRNYAFARHCVLGEEPKLEIKGLWMWRGTEIPFDMKDHPQFEYYTTRKLDHTKEEDRKLIEAYWEAKDEESIVDGLLMRTSKWLK